MFQAFNNYADFSGRASRSEYWWFQLLNVIVLVFAVAIILTGAAGASLEDFGRLGAASASFLMGAALLVFWLLISLIPQIAVTVRRFHDHNISGWWCLGLYVLGLIPYLGLLANIGMLLVLAREGTHGPNDYGPDSVNPWRGNTTFA